MYGFIQTGFLYHLSMLVFLAVGSCGIVFGVFELLKLMIRKRKC